MDARNAVDQAVDRLRQMAADPAMTEPALRAHTVHELESLLAQLRATGAPAGPAVDGSAEDEFSIAM